MPVLNRREQFERAIKSILSQDCSGIQIVVIDGGSSDGTLDVIEKYSDHISYWETGLDKGIVDAFNRGILRSSGGLVAILNSDDYWEQDAIKKLLACVRENPNADVYHGSLKFVDPSRHYSYIRLPSISALKFRMSVFHATMFVRNRCYKEVGLYKSNYSYAMDSEWCHRSIEQGATYCKVPAVLSVMSLGGVSDREYVKSLSEYRRSVIEHHLASRVEAFLYFYFNVTVKWLMAFRLLRPLKLIRDVKINPAT